MCNFLIFVKMRFLIHNFVSRYACKPIKGSKFGDYSLIFNKILSQKMSCWIGQVCLTKELKAHPHFDVAHREFQMRNGKYFVFNLN